MEHHVFAKGFGYAPMVKIPDHWLHDRQHVVSHGLGALTQVMARETRCLERLVDVEVKQAHFGLRHTFQGGRVDPDELHERVFREAGIERDLRLLQHSDIVLVPRPVARSGGVSQAASDVGVQPHDLDRLCEGISPSDAARIEEVHDRSEDGLVSLAARDPLEWDLPPLEKLDEADPFDVFRGISLSGVGTDEPEQSQLLQALGGLPGGGTEFLDGQVRRVWDNECSLHRSLPRRIECHQVRLSLTARSRQEIIDRRRIEVEHLGSRQLPFAYLIDAEHRRLQAVARWADATLLPEDDDLLRTSRHHARIHSPLRLGRLQREPGVRPCGTRRSAAVRERWRPEELDVGLAEVEDALRVAPLDRAEDLEHHLNIFAAAHDLSPRKSRSMTASYVARISGST